MKYAQIDANRKIIGWFDKELHSSIPDNAVEFTDELWLTAITSGHNHVSENNQTDYVDYVVYPEDVECLMAKQYLSDTDWYVTRKIETGKEIPSDVSEKRNASRIILSS